MKKISIPIIVILIALFAACNNDPPGENTKPVADAGGDQTVTVGASAQLDGSGSSDADGDALTYAWAITSAPEGSTAALSNAAIVNPAFTPDLAGKYNIQLVVNDGNENSNTNAITITAIDPASMTLEVLSIKSREGYYVDILFNKDLEETPAETIGNYKIEYRIYELFVTGAELSADNRTVTLTTSNSQVDESRGIQYQLAIKNIKDVYGYSIETEKTFYGSEPYTIADWGDEDNIRIYGSVKNEDGQPMKDAGLSVSNRGPDGEYGVYWGVDDDINLTLKTLDSGLYELNGLSDQHEYANYYGGAWFDMYVYPLNAAIEYEGISVWPSIYPPATSINIDFILYKAVSGTTIEGYLKDQYGNLIEDGNMSIQIWRGTPHSDSGSGFMIYGSAQLSNQSEDTTFEYNSVTGFYRISGLLAGGDYTITVGTNNDYDFNFRKSLTAAPGAATNCDITITKLTANGTAPLTMTAPAADAAPASPIVFNWEESAFSGIQSYALGIWSSAYVNVSGEYPVPQGPPDMFYYIVPDTISLVGLTADASPMTVSGDTYRIVTNVQLSPGETYYWGVFAFDAPYNSADISGQFSGEPENGLWSFTAP